MNARGVVLVAALVAGGVPSSAAPRDAAERPGAVLGRITVLDGAVEVAAGTRGWQPVRETTPLRIGDRVRTGVTGSARVEFPWMTMVAAPGSVIAVPRQPVLSVVLEAGRSEQASAPNAFVKLETPEAEVRGTGRVVVRREGERTLVMVWSGQARVEARGGAVDVVAGQGTVVGRDGKPAAPVALPQPTRLESAANDSVYVVLGQPVTLRWDPAAGAQHLQVLPLVGDDPVYHRDVPAGEASVQLPWLGTYRWRVSGRDARGLEGVPSEEGLFTVVEK